MQFQRRPKSPQIKQTYGVSVFTFCLALEDISKKYWETNTVSDLFQSTECVKTRLDKLSTVVVEVTTLVGNPVSIYCTNIYIQLNRS